MPIVGFHASHEQLPPSRLIAAVQAAEEAGFTAAMCSDHFAPWGERQDHSGHAWSWLGAAMQATSGSLQLKMDGYGFRWLRINTPDQHPRRKHVAGGSERP